MVGSGVGVGIGVPDAASATVEDCAKITDKQVRLECFDAMSKAAATPVTTAWKSYLLSVRQGFKQRERAASQGKLARRSRGRK
jgi:hypothetical protein